MSRSLFKSIVIACALLATCAASFAQDVDEYLWKNRPVVVFADTPDDPRLLRQLELLELEIEMMAERDVVVIVDTDPNSKSALRIALRPRGFTWVLIGKDGNVKLRKPHPWTAREISRVIDKMPLRQQEMRQRWEK